MIIFIPVIQAIAKKIGHSGSRYLLPLSYAAILGGMTTLIGSSTNLQLQFNLLITILKLAFLIFLFQELL